MLLLTQQFLSLFDGAREAVGLEEGGCLRLPDPIDWELHVEAHLEGGGPIGVYPMTTMIDDDWTTLGATDGPWRWVVKWGCVDFDEGDEESWIHASNLYHVLDQFGIKAWIERSRSKGYHVWVFLDDWLDPDTVRRSLLAACQIVSAPSKEVNPKQTSLKAGQLGNYVRLPYPGALAKGAVRRALDVIDPERDRRRVMLGLDGLPYTLNWFVDVALNTLTTEKQLLRLADYYIAPSYSTPENRDWSKLQGSAVDRLTGKARIIWEQGPLENPGSPTNFRGQTLWKLARQIVEDGKHSPEETLELLTDADRRWGKFWERHDGEDRLRALVEKAFGGSSEAVHEVRGGQA